MNKSIVMAALLGATVLAGCSSIQPGSPESFAKLEKERVERENDRLEDLVDDMPKWYLKVPTSDHAVYASGTSSAKDPQYAIEKAVLRAKITLADRLDGKLSQQNKSVVADDTEIGTQITKNVINGVNVSGYRVKEKELLIENGSVRAYVLLEYPIGGYNDVLKYKQEQEAKALKQKNLQDALKSM